MYAKPDVLTLWKFKGKLFLGRIERSVVRKKPVTCLSFVGCDVVQVVQEFRSAPRFAALRNHSR